MFITIDIETIGTKRQDVRDYIAASIKPPGTIKLAASIEKWNKESKADAVAEAIDKTSFDGAFGQVVCIGYKIDEHATEAVYGLDEVDVLSKFNQSLSKLSESERFTTTVIGHNVISFDLRFLLQRYIVNGIKPNFVLNRAVHAKAYESEKVFDTMLQFAGFGNKISLDKLCFALGVPTSKDEMDGSMVGQYVEDGRLEEVVKYCKKDVDATYQAFKRMTFQ